MKNNKFLFVLTVLLICTLILYSCNNTDIEKKVNQILKNDLNSTIEIVKLYYNEEKQGCFVEFHTDKYVDKAAINLDTGEIEYKNEFDYWVAKAEELKNQKPINENELHKYNQKIIDSFYATWSFSIAVFEVDGRPEESDWERIK